MKRCVRCHQMLSTAMFRPNARLRSGLNSWCKPCVVERTRQWRSDHPEYELAHNAARRVKVARLEREKVCGSCGASFVTPTGTQHRLCVACRTARSSARAMARQRFDRGSRDVTAEEVARMKALADRCPLCSCRMVDELGHPRKKHLDHIIPVNVGGRHTLTNVRVICQSCNLARPKDGADVAQLVMA